VEESNQKIDQSIFYKKEEEIITFSRIYDILIGKYKLLIFSGFLGFIISVPYSLLLTPMYSSRNIMLIPTTTSPSIASSLGDQLGGLASFAGIQTGSTTSNRKETLAIFHSRVFREKALNDLNLMPYLYKEQWDSSNKAWKEGQEPNLYDALLLFQDISRLEEDIKRGLFVYVMEWDDPILVAKWSNEVIALFNNYMRERAIVEAEKSTDYLEAELVNTKTISLQNVLYKMIADQRKNAMLASVREDYAFKIIDPAVIPNERSSPNRTQIVVLSSGATFMVGIFIIFLMHIYRKR
jgi:uncharacterized protein involved in exopolysaccharide biosynthesis